MLGLQTELRGDVVLVKHLCNKMQTAMNDLININLCMHILTSLIFYVSTAPKGKAKMNADINQQINGTQ